MAARQIADETALAPPPMGSNRTDNYVRSKCDPHTLICGKDGVNYARRDGARWEWPAYKITRERNDSVTVKGCTAYGDSGLFKKVD